MSHCSEGQMIYRGSSKLLQRDFRPDCVNHRTNSKKKNKKKTPQWSENVKIMIHSFLF